MGSRAYDYVPASLSLAYQKKVCPSTTISTSQAFLSHRNRGNSELSKRSNCSVHQGTKVSLAEERNQDILNPQRVSQQVNILSPSKVYYQPQGNWVSPADLNIPQCNMQTFLTSIPGSLDLRLFPGGIPDIQWNHSPSTVSKSFPRRVEPSPQ